mmetsp:Transcript_13567/g.29847  ORF Transcript_13567/g.29847 Transcript_13567/m.29847 type:complete len:337 (+) Transcript_13567:60-1070(+)
MPAMARLFAVMAVGVGAHSIETVCLGRRAHRISYSLEGGETLDTIKNANISVVPDRSSDADCLGSDGDKVFCIGANVDPSCKQAAEVLPLPDGLDCKNCFVGAQADLYYTLNISGTRLQAVSVGLRDAHVRMAAEVHIERDESKKTSGSKILSNRTASFNFKVAKIIPVDISLILPTVIHYDADFEGHEEFTAGVDVDVILGDHHVNWTKEDGFQSGSSSPKVEVTPVLLPTVSTTATLGLRVHSSIEVSIDKVMWYHLNMKPSMPIAVDPDGKGEVCATGGLDVVTSQEADLHFQLVGMEHDVAHFGPKQLSHFHKDNALDLCRPIPTKLGEVIV